MNKEREFSRSLDNILAGRDVNLDDLTDAEIRTSLDFARRMTTLRAEPSLQFKSNLKARLLQKLNERETAGTAGKNWLLLLLQHPTYTVAGALLVMAIVFGSLWASGIFVTTPEAAVLKVEAATDRSAYRPGETVSIQVSLKNATGEELNFNEFPPILSLMKKDNNQAAYTFAAGTETMLLAPDETITFILIWNQRDAFGNQAASGSYYIELEDLYYQGNAVKLTPDKPVEFKII